MIITTFYINSKIDEGDIIDSKNIIIENEENAGTLHDKLMKKGSQFFNEQWEILPELYKDIAWPDPETGLIWLPINVNVEEKGMVFAEGTDKHNWKWAGTKYIPVTEEDDEKYKDVKWKPDMSTIRHYGARDFMEALSYIGVLPE